MISHNSVWVNNFNGTKLQKSNCYLSVVEALKNKHYLIKFLNIHNQAVKNIVLPIFSIYKKTGIPTTTEKHDIIMILTYYQVYHRCIKVAFERRA